MRNSDTKAARLLKWARQFLVLHKPFLATLALNLRYQETPDLTLPTGDPGIAAVDGRTLFYRPDTFGELRQDEATAVLAHEVLHVALAHHLRREERDPFIWNCACDYVINLILQQEGFSLPAGCLIDQKYHNMSSEQVYQELQKWLQRMKRIGAGGKDGNAGLKPDPLGQVLDATDEDGHALSEADKRAMEAELRVQVQQAKAIDDANDSGTGSASADRAVEALQQKADWKRELSEFLVSSPNLTDFTWLRPNRRYIQFGLYLPSMFGQSLGEIVVGVDTSGSISKEMLMKFAGVMEDILATFPDTVLHVVYCDASVKSSEVLTKSDVPLRLGEAKGGGGTRFTPVFEWVEEQGIQPTCLIYLTDMIACTTDYPYVPPYYPAVWVTDNPWAAAPFGRVIRAIN